MRASFTQSLRTALSGAIASALVLSASLSYADDTEIFFGGPLIDGTAKPNVLFLLDNSGSMAWRLDRDNAPTQASHGDSRMTVLKSAFSDIVKNASGVNIGVMALNTRADFYSNRIVYPVEYIDAAVGITAASPEIVISADDATRQTTAPASTNLNNQTLVMGYVKEPEPVTKTVIRDLSQLGSQDSAQDYSNNNSTYYLNGNYSCSVKISDARDNCETGERTELNARSNSSGQTGLFLFRNLNIPKGVTITNAYITLTPRNNNGTKPVFSNNNLGIENSKTPAALNDATSIADRSFTNFSIAAGSVPNWQANVAFNLPITSQLQTLQTQAPSADPISDVTIRLRANNNSDYRYAVGDTADSPKLTIIYSNSENAARSTGLRFQNVAIPKGAVITAARLDFVAAGSDNRPVTFNVSAQNTGNANAFGATENFTTRTKTAATPWTPIEWRTESPPAYLEGPNVLAQVQQVVDHRDWCGNNAMAFFIDPIAGEGSRTTFSVDGSDLKPVLRINFSGGENGCFNPVLDLRLTAAVNDARQAGTGSSPNLGQTALSMAGNNTFVGVRYENLPIKRGAQILDAQVTVTRSSTDGSVNSTVAVQNAGNSQPFEASNNNLSGRTLTSAEACTLTGPKTICSGSTLRSSLQSVFARNDWNDGNALSLIIKTPSTNNSSTYSAMAYDGSPSQSIRLRLKLGDGGLGSNINTVRNHLNGIVQQMNASGGTPIVPSIYDATRYLSEKHHNSGSPSPITDACQPTHLVLLTDGKPEGAVSTSELSAIESMTGASCSTDGLGYADERCARELASWMANSDQSSFDGNNFIYTHTIGFALDARPTNEATMIKSFLADLAKEGKGTAYTANDAATLADSFDQIIQEVLATDSSFVSASAPVNSFERQDNRDELYYSLFRPQESNRWLGNLKRYRFSFYDNDNKLNPGIYDWNNMPAVNAKSGQFNDGARSWWSANPDGNNTEAGGAASVLPSATSRKLYTSIGGSPSNPTTMSNIVSTNTAIKNEMLGVNNDTERKALINYILGIDPVTSGQRKVLGDPIHSSPRLATYSCLVEEKGTCKTADQSAFIGSNEGYLHAFNTETGVEQFAFMPEALLPNIKLLQENKKSTAAVPRRYGMDNPVTLWVNDIGNGTPGNTIPDGKILNNPGDTTPQAGEFIYAYATMGRGGRDIYALDVTNRNAPKLLWFIKGGTTPGFEKLGQTWSVPIKTKINVGGTITDVLIFAGGYDPKQDDVTVRTTDTMGNAIYIVNAKTGARIWAASNTTGHDLILPKMQYSIPANLRVIDLQTSPSGALDVDKDRLADQIFVGDMGGQVWRLFIENGKSGSNLVTAAGTNGDGVFATSIPANYNSLDLPLQRQNLRRFYNEPDVALLTKDGVMTLSVNIGSGYRGHPLDKNAQDYFYSFRTKSLGTSLEGTITESDMLDITQKLQPGNAAETSRLKLDNREKGGWIIKLPLHTGEKVLTRALTAGQGSILFFNTYEPGSNSSSCKAAFGTSRGYAVYLFDGFPYEAGDSPAKPSDRFSELTSLGLPPQPEVICIGEHCGVIQEKDKIPKIDAPFPGKMYWIDQTELD